MKRVQPYRIQEVQKSEYDHIIEFVTKIRKEIFPMLCEDQLPQDFINIEQ